jgi:CubicO group peptidase (beta-lactamase class C family)
MCRVWRWLCAMRRGRCRRGASAARRTSGAPVTPRTLWSLQSQSKMYTATAVLIAVQDGLLDLDVPITAYLPGFSVRSLFEADPADRMTLRHLLSHTAGFTHEAPEGSNYRVGSASFAAHCASIRQTWLRAPVGHHFEYSNLGIDLAAEILTTVTGTSFSTFLGRRVLDPLGASRATLTTGPSRATPTGPKDTMQATTGCRFGYRCWQVAASGHAWKMHAATPAFTSHTAET